MYDSQIATRSTDIIYHFNELTMQLNFMKTLMKIFYTHTQVSIQRLRPSNGVQS